MKSFFLFLSLIYSDIIFSQNMIHGIVTDGEFGGGLVGAFVSVKGTQIQTQCDIDGKYQIKPLDTNSVLTFLAIGYITKDIKTSKDSIINVILKSDKKLLFDKSKYVTISLNSDLINAPLGLSFSNGIDEFYCLHFEDFQQKLLYKVGFRTDFNKNNSFYIKGLYHGYCLFDCFNNISIDYNYKNYPTINFNFQGIGIQNEIGTPIGRWLLRIGNQTLNKKNNFGVETGLQMELNHSGFYCGLLLGYWKDYFTYKTYLSKFIYKRKLNLLSSFERIYNCNFYTIGLNFMIDFK